jgi:hypothetical protein
MEKEFVPYQMALDMKSIGFDEPCLAKYQKLSETANYQLQLLQKERNCNRLDTAISAPLYQQVFRWFREKYNLHTWIYQVDNGKFFFSSLKNGRYIVCNSIEFTTYEEAEVECLKKLIEIVNNKK